VGAYLERLGDIDSRVCPEPLSVLRIIFFIIHRGTSFLLRKL
jgi:hypothetical protein